MIAKLSEGASSPPPDCLLACTLEEIELVYALHLQAISSSDNPLGRAEELERLTANLMGMEGRDAKELKVDNIIKGEKEKEKEKNAGSSVATHWAVGGDGGINLNSTVKLWGLTGNGASLNGSLGVVQKLGAERLTIKIDIGGEGGRIVRVKIDNLILVDAQDGEEEFESEKELPPNKGVFSSSSLSSSSPQPIKKKLIWQCTTCSTSCLPPNSESRCLCGHRQKNHSAPGDGVRSACLDSKCPCRDFFYIPADGSWTLRCECKRKAVEHDPKPGKHLSTKLPLGGFVCKGFSSPWVCNCGHDFKSHKQTLVDLISSGSEVVDGVVGIAATLDHGLGRKGGEMGRGDDCRFNK